uniref:CypT n=2 Tax=Primula vulgaris TaxID=175104 RepID=A0A1L2F377_9ERIC|nr:CypT [Primula vulgaris]
MQVSFVLCFLLLCFYIYIIFAFLIRAGYYLWWRPRRIQLHFSKHGIRGPNYHVLSGNTKELVDLTVKAASQTFPRSPHNIVPKVLPFYHQWKKIYGATFLLWFGPVANLTLSDPVLITEILISKSSELFEKTESPQHVRKVEGDGLITLRGEKWVHHRKIITPSFYIDNLKLMVPIMGNSMVTMLNKWVEISKNSTIEIDVSHWFQDLTEEIISHIAFGRSCKEGKPIFALHSQNMAYAIGSYNKFFISAYRFLPTKQNRQFCKLNREMKISLTKLINQRMKDNNNFIGASSEQCPDDLLELMVKASKKNVQTKQMSARDAFTTYNIIEECKTILFAGKYTTSAMMTWTTVLLAMHPLWQELARKEVLRVCMDHDFPTKDDVTKLKTLSMILNESLRLYPPVVALLRRAKSDMEFGGCTILRGTELLIPIVGIHHDLEIWSQEATEFNPSRFAPGVSKATKHPTAFMPFGLGNRRCVGQNLAILQTKLAIAMILKRFSFNLAPSYEHAPTVVMFLDPQYRAPITFHTL